MHLATIMKGSATKLQMWLDAYWLHEKVRPSVIPSQISQSSTMVENSQDYRLYYWATRSSVRSFARTAHSLACSGLFASLAPSAALTRSLARSLHSLPRSWDSE